MPRLLQRFQQCVGRRLRHGLGGFDHHHSPLGFHGLTCQKPTHTSNLLQPQLRRSPATESGFLRLSTGEQASLVLICGLQPKQIRVIALHQTAPLTRRQHPTSQHPLKQPQRCKAAPHTLRTREEVGRSKTLLLQRCRQQIHSKGLPDQIGEQISHPIAPEAPAPDAD